MQKFFITALDGLRLSVSIFEKENPLALVQIVHGSVEHKERYYSFARFLNENGYAVILSDNRGHGASVNEEYCLGYMDGYKMIVEDLFLVSEVICSKYPGVELYLFGHSLGSVFARCYLQNHDARISKLVLSGTVFYNIFTPLGLFLVKTVIAIRGKRRYNRFLRSLVKNANGMKWISNSAKNREEFLEDPLCGFPYTDSAVLTVMEAVGALNKIQKYECANPNLSILSITGADDPVAGGELGLKRTFRFLKKIGYHNFTNIVYPGMRHEVLREENSYMVFDDIISFFKK